MKNRSYRDRKNRGYQDRFAADGIICSGWRYVRKGGIVLFGGSRYHHPKLKEIIGELVRVDMADYWQNDVYIYRGVIGCTGFYCEAHI